ncbi:MAG TPA: DUF721 domain-containing protein [Gammaproteobacteria bacterium]|nr:DUF721 domain-containing protein [Gammaproteobacteria bacterium]
MFKLKFNRIYMLLKNNKMIANSVTKSLSDMEKFEAFLKKNLPEEINKHCHPLHLTDSELVLVVDSAAWNTKLRFIIPSLEKKLRKHYPGQVRKIRIKVCLNNVRHETPAREKHRRATLSEDSQSVIIESAEDMADSDLKESLLRLAGNRKTPVKD